MLWGQFLPHSERHNQGFIGFPEGAAARERGNDRGIRGTNS
jgi:hypothetical protein